MNVIVRFTLLLAGLLWLILAYVVFLRPPELCGSIPGYLSPDERSLGQYALFGAFICTTPLFFAMGYPRRMKVRRVMRLFFIAILATGLVALCCYGLMQHLSHSHHCVGVTVD
ncbi:hypothetical protein [Pantoea sp. DY-5]|uniref:hypothetical protein n=1 Tax=Pantoea sp. DY-5 TaxID=2871488 RepID=UPI001C9645DA|nr:hypothetical protein [Pantoea sp. DY-5]MBY4841262.1 hypothetical protein [Pantoea sp. DY-5]